MSRDERYEWENYEIDPLDRLDMLITVARKGLKSERSENPYVEKDLLAFELIQEHSQNIIDRRWWVACAAGVLAPTIEGIAGGLFFGNIASGVGTGLVLGIMTLPFAVTLAKAISEELIFIPSANRFVKNRLGFEK